MKLALAALLWLHPMLSDGRLEATSEPSLGVRAGHVVHGTYFGVGVGTGYQSVRGSFVLPPAPGYTGIVVEAEHLFRDGEHRYWRGTFPVSQRHPLYATLEHEYHKRILWDYPNGEAGKVPTVDVREEHYYLSWHGQRVLARLGASKRGVGFTLSSRF